MFHRHFFKHRHLSEVEAFRELDYSIFFHFTGRLLYRIFVPVLLLMNGYDLDYVFIYLIGYSVLTVILAILANQVLAQHNVIFFNVIAILAEICLIFLLLPNTVSWPILIAIIFGEAIYFSFYYISLYSITCHYSTKKNTGNNLGNMQIVVSLANMVAPILGAFLLAVSKPLFISVALIFLLISILFVLQVSRTDINRADLPTVNLADIKDDLFSYAIFCGMEFAVFVLWGIYVYISGFSLLYIGLIPAADALVNIIFVYALKNRISETGLREKTQILAVCGMIAVSLYRFFLPSHIFVTNLAVALFLLAYSLSVETGLYQKLENHQTYFSSMIMESIGFSMWAVVGTAAFFIGLKLTILIPVALGVAWLFHKAFIKKTSWQAVPTTS
jgi:MFS family permease